MFCAYLKLQRIQNHVASVSVGSISRWPNQGSKYLGPQPVQSSAAIFMPFWPLLSQHSKDASPLEMMRRIYLMKVGGWGWMVEGIVVWHHKTPLVLGIPTWVWVWKSDACRKAKANALNALSALINHIGSSPYMPVMIISTLEHVDMQSDGSSDGKRWQKVWNHFTTQLSNLFALQW